MLRFTLAASLLVLFGILSRPVAAADPQIARGKYLVTITGCSDCHTPGSLMGKPDMQQYLGGSDVGFATPNGVFVAPNLTPDKETGLGNWTTEEIIVALTKGERPDQRVLAPIMPYDELSSLTRSDALAIVAYLRSLPPVSHKVPGPFGLNETPSVFVMSVQPGEVFAKLPKPPQ
jgi:mono/diheme cytochrome c family protein